MFKINSDRLKVLQLFTKFFEKHVYIYITLIASQSLKKISRCLSIVNIRFYSTYLLQHSILLWLINATFYSILVYYQIGFFFHYHPQLISYFYILWFPLFLLLTQVLKLFFLYSENDNWLLFILLHCDFRWFIMLFMLKFKWNKDYAK